MATFIALVNFTEQGVGNFAESPQRARAFAEMLEGMGGALKDIYWTLGTYDLVVTFEAPDDETATAAALKVSSQGNVRTTTLRAFDMEETEAIIGRAG